MKQPNPLQVALFLVLFLLGIWIAYILYSMTGQILFFGIVLATFVIAMYLAAAVQLANQWEKAVVLRLGNTRDCMARGYSPSHR